MRGYGMTMLLPLLVAAGCGGGSGEAVDTTPSVVTQTTRLTVTETVRTPPVIRTVTRVSTVRQPAQPKPQATAPVTTVRVPAPTADPRATPTGRPRFVIALTADGHEAEPGRAWSYDVRMTADGKPAGGTAKMRVYADGVLVDTVGFFAFRGRLRRTHVWPRVLSGKRVVFQAEVEGAGGTRRANWPVTIG